MLSFLIDSNLGLDPAGEPWREVFARIGIASTSTTDLAELDRSVAAHEPDIVFLPIADFHRVLASGDRHYRGLTMLTSRLTGSTNLPSVLVVRKDDPATCLTDLAGASFGYINSSCTSSYYALAILVQRSGFSLADFGVMCRTAPWQGQIDAVVSGDVRATMVLEDVWKSAPVNADTTKIVGRYDRATGAVTVIREGLAPPVVSALRDALLTWKPQPGALFGGFATFTESGVAAFFADLDQLPATL
ncbi:PhnD/SsuA/transferrin family substrate-binding protein [Mycolicibacterium aichiense]|uniref:PhnD/SsuA/transferrin family substrate-binding protein n=1 Tax=Mycolicibacterium aichiense TaxID=1799 RepID=UPI003D67363F